VPYDIKVVDEDPTEPVIDTITEIVYPTFDPATIIIRESYYINRGSKDRLKKDCKNDEVLVASDTNNNGGKRYKIIDVDEWLNNCNKYDRNEYECLRGVVKPYADIETEDMTVDSYEMIKNIIGIYSNVLLQNGFIINGVAVADSSKPTKHSFHLVFDTDKVFETTKYLEIFLKDKLYPEIAKSEFNDCFDKAVYSTDRLIRFINQSKLGKKVQLKPTRFDFEVVGGYKTNIRDFLIGDYFGENRPIYEVKLPEYLEKIKKQQGEGTFVAEPVAFTTGYVDELLSIIDNQYIQSGTVCCKLIWGAIRSGASAEVVHKHCKRVNNYDEPWVNYHIQRAAQMSINIGTLCYYASLSDKKTYKQFVIKHQKNQILSEVSQIKTDLPTINYSERYVQPIDIKSKDTILIKSHLGTGKTTQIVKLLQEHKELKRILIISGRRSFSKFILNDLKDKGINFKSYDDNKIDCDLALVPRLVVQVESLWKLESSFESYDFVIVDESETILHQFYSEATHNGHSITNHIIFERCITSAKKVLYADAFLNQRTIYNANILRNSEHSIFIHNDFCPYKRTATKLIRHHKTKEGKILKRPALTEFCNRIMSDLKNGLRVVVVWTSRAKGNAFAESFLNDSKYNWRYYNSESSPEERNELSNVEENWKKLDCLMMTSSITVGVNYNPNEEKYQFDKLYLYASAAGALPRDIAQSLMRCRQIKSNELIYTVDDRTFQTSVYGVDAIREAIEVRSRLLIQQAPDVKWTNAPKWVQENYIFNENENSAKAIVFTDVLDLYLKESGYSLTVNNYNNEEEVKLESITPSYFEIDTINRDTAEKISNKSKRDLATTEELWELYKYRFLNNIKTDDEIALCAIWTKWIQKKSNEPIFWNLVNEKHQTTERFLNKESQIKFIETSTKKCVKRIVLDKVFAILKVNNSGDVIEIENIKEYTDKLREIEEEVYAAFQSHKSRRKTEFGFSNAVDLIKMVYSSWSGQELKTQRMVSNGVKKGFKVQKNKMELWDLITNREEQKREENEVYMIRNEEGKYKTANAREEL
jgi:hypothetical protein